MGRGEDGRGREERKGKGGVRACPPTRNFWLRHRRYTLPHFTLVALEMCAYILDGVVGKISFPVQCFCAPHSLQPERNITINRVVTSLVGWLVRR